MCELAIVSSRRSQLERRAGGGDSGARATLILANDPGRFLASLQIGITSVAVLTGTFSGATLAHRLDDWLDLFPAISPYSKPIAFALIVVSVTFLSLLFGELVPKQIALKNPVLEVFRKTPVNTAIIIDEYGTVQGIVTRTDLLEAVAGRLPDVDAKPEPKISRREDGSFVIDAATPVGEVVARLGLKEPQEQGLVTVAGLVLSKLDHGPQPGARVSYDGWDFEILEVEGTRIKSLLAVAKGQDQLARVSRPQN
jgi:CBS domain containing-hemolysin-like protein